MRGDTRYNVDKDGGSGDGQDNGQNGQEGGQQNSGQNGQNNKTKSNPKPTDSKSDTNDIDAPAITSQVAMVPYLDQIKQSLSPNSFYFSAPYAATVIPPHFSRKMNLTYTPSGAIYLYTLEPIKPGDEITIPFEMDDWQYQQFKTLTSAAYPTQPLTAQNEHNLAHSAQHLRTASGITPRQDWDQLEKNGKVVEGDGLGGELKQKKKKVEIGMEEELQQKISTPDGKLLLDFMTPPKPAVKIKAKMVPVDGKKEKDGGDDGDEIETRMYRLEQFNKRYIHFPMNQLLESSVSRFPFLTQQSMLPPPKLNHSILGLAKGVLDVGGYVPHNALQIIDDAARSDPNLNPDQNQSKHEAALKRLQEQGLNPEPTDVNPYQISPTFLFHKRTIQSIYHYADYYYQASQVDAIEKDVDEGSKELGGESENDGGDGNDGDEQDDDGKGDQPRRMVKHTLFEVAGGLDFYTPPQDEEDGDDGQGEKKQSKSKPANIQLYQQPQPKQVRLLNTSPFAHQRENSILENLTNWANNTKISLDNRKTTQSAIEHHNTHYPLLKHADLTVLDNLFQETASPMKMSLNHTKAMANTHSRANTMTKNSTKFNPNSTTTIETIHNIDSQRHFMFSLANLQSDLEGYIYMLGLGLYHEPYKRVKVDDLLTTAQKKTQPPLPSSMKLNQLKRIQNEHQEEEYRRKFVEGSKVDQFKNIFFSDDNNKIGSASTKSAFTSTQTPTSPNPNSNNDVSLFDFTKNRIEYFSYFNGPSKLNLEPEIHFQDFQALAPIRRIAPFLTLGLIHTIMDDAGLSLSMKHYQHDGVVGGEGQGEHGQGDGINNNTDNTTNNTGASTAIPPRVPPAPKPQTPSPTTNVFVGDLVTADERQRVKEACNYSAKLWSRAPYYTLSHIFNTIATTVNLQPMYWDIGGEMIKKDYAQNDNKNSNQQQNQNGGQNGQATNTIPMIDFALTTPYNIHTASSSKSGVPLWDTPVMRCRPGDEIFMNSDEMWENDRKI